MLRKKIKLYYFALIVSLLNLILYHFAFYQFIVNHIEVASLNGMVLLISLTLLAIVLNALVFYIGLFLLGIVGKWLLVLFFNTNAIALYFINTYGVIIDKTMIGNILNTRFEESSSFFSLPLILYVLFLGIIPSIFLFRFTIISVKIKQFSFHVLAALFFLLTLAFANASNWLWIDKHSKTLGAIVMPWSYVVNTIRFFQHQSEKNKTQILLPNATLKNNTKSIVVLVIGESARSANFSLYGYHKKTNPILSTIKDLHVYPAKSAATYTTAGVKAILDHKETNQLYEILPNYLDRNGVAVIWRTTNWGEPTVKAKNYANKEALRAACKKPTCLYDEVLLHDLKTEIQNTKKDKIFVVLHTSTSHGPTYFKKYPAQFNQFTPVCKSVVLADCSQEELINAYDNTILYTDYILANVIKELRQLDDYQTTMLYVSDHGESLGEKNLYMHGIPMAIAPKEQVEIPFIAWSATDSIVFKEPYEVSQYHVFHSVLDLLAIDSPIYNEQMSIVKKNN
ncbi:phosphoethanolamine--lipid A transferase EptA [Tenacibaculum maritimum]|uniref:phosphoethanolamine--lipid A transferase EptA n=1 Tax=Tenacibaculum maritimum TaxID=107401 RepID=UPI00387729A3